MSGMLEVFSSSVLHHWAIFCCCVQTDTELFNIKNNKKKRVNKLLEFFQNIAA
jgi:hypothetical protein